MSTDRNSRQTPALVELVKKELADLFGDDCTVRPRRQKGSWKVRVKRPDKSLYIVHF